MRTANFVGGGDFDMKTDIWSFTKQQHNQNHNIII